MSSKPKAAKKTATPKGKPLMEPEVSGSVPTGPKSRVGKVVKPDKKTPATFQPGPPATPPPPPFDARAVAEKLNLWRADGAKGCHFRESRDGEFIDMSGDDFSRCMKREGVRLKPAEGEYLSQVDLLKDYVQEERRVDFAMSNLAGYAAGVYSVSGASMLVKKSPKLITPAPGDWSFLEKLIDRLLGGGATSLSQVTLFHCWMKLAMDREQQSGLALILAGPRNCGKSLLQHLVITPLLGCRNADPGPHMFGDTDFNAELFGSEHLQMEDPAPKRGFSRETFAEKIKGIVANNTHRFHPKGRDAVTLAPKWHLTISVNDDPETMRIIPDLRDDVTDKFILLRVQRPYDGDGFNLPTVPERPFFRSLIAKQLPAYAAFLRDLEIPKEYAFGRLGLVPWQNPTLAGELFTASPSGKLLSLIDETKLWEASIRDGLPSGAGSYAEIRGELERHLTQGDEAKAFFKHQQIEKLLGKLKESNPDRVKHVRFTSGPEKGRFYWQICQQPAPKTEPASQPAPNEDSEPDGF